MVLIAWLASGVWGLFSAPARGADAAAAGPQAVQDAQYEILMVFSSKCAKCHGAEVKKPKKGFKYCMDLKRMGENPKLVVPLNPEKSKLYDSVDSDDMPPEDGVPLTPHEKELVLSALKTWIMAGAPAPQGSAAARSTTQQSPDVVAAPTLTPWKRTWVLAGKFHPLLAHFPIALLVAAAVAELVWLRTRQSWLTGVVRFCTLFGAAGAVLTAGLGWVDAISIPGDSTLTMHRWLGTAGALWAIPVLLLSERGFKYRRDNPEAGDPRPWFSLMLFAGVVLVGLAAHFGGDLVYGTDYLSW